MFFFEKIIKLHVFELSKSTDALFRQKNRREIHFWNFQSDYALVFDRKYNFSLKFWVYPGYLIIMDLRHDFTKIVISSDCGEISRSNFAGK